MEMIQLLWRHWSAELLASNSCYLKMPHSSFYSFFIGYSNQNDASYHWLSFCSITIFANKQYLSYLLFVFFWKSCDKLSSHVIRKYHRSTQYKPLDLVKNLKCLEYRLARNSRTVQKWSFWKGISVAHYTVKVQTPFRNSSNEAPTSGGNVFLLLFTKTMLKERQTC